MTTATTNDALPHVVIIGGGFGGLYAAMSLRRTAARITVVDRRNHHLFQPLLYQVATAALNPSDIAAPIRSILRKNRKLSVLLAEVVRVDVAAKKVILSDGELDYDQLVVAAGVSHSYFGHESWAPYAPGLKSIEDALEVRRRILFAYEAAERTTDADERKAWLTFVVVGAGPTGVEMAGAMAEIAHHAMVMDFRRIDPHAARVILVEGEDRVLPGFEAALAPKAMRQLEKLGVEVRLGVRVTGIDDRSVMITRAGSEPERVAAHTVMWAAGVIASPIAASLGVPLDRAGRVLVEPDLTIPGHPEVFVIGDLAALTIGGESVPGVAPAAIQEGKHAAANIKWRLAGKPTRPFRYVDKGMLATIGRAAAVGTLGKVKLSGFLAWATWAFVHLVYLVGFRSRILVFIEWAWSYFTYQRGARLITGPIDRHILGPSAGSLRQLAAPASTSPSEPVVSATPPSAPCDPKLSN